QPAMRLHVPLRDDVAIVVVGAYPAEGGPQGVALDGGPARAGSLVANRVGDVHPLDNLGVAHRHVGVGRSVRNAVVGEAIADSQEIQADAVSHSVWGAALLHRVHYWSDGAFGNAAYWVGFVETVLRRLRQLGQVAQRWRYCKADCMLSDCVIFLRD